MVRNSFALKLRPGKLSDFGRLLGENWQALTAHLDACDIHNFSIWNAENLLFGYFETDYIFTDLEEEKKDFFRSLNQTFEGIYDWISEPWKPMSLMYQDFGIVRQSKELIRHRVFMTKLVPGSEAEYKRRHDVLVTARGKNVTKGPDSNFSIWSAGGYIFGYDEIDTTMEHDRTEEDRQADIAWETKMFEIMSWITNDVDWISGEHHVQVKRICSHL